MPAYMWRLYELRDDEERKEDFFFTWQEWIIFLLVFGWGLVMGKWVCQLFYIHQCYITTGGLTTYEIVKHVHDNFDEKYKRSPHKKGNSCTNFCRMVCF